MDYEVSPVGYWVETGLWWLASLDDPGLRAIGALTMLATSVPGM